MRLHLHVRQTARWLCIGLLLLVGFAIGAFGLLQTSVGLGWAGRSIAGLLSSPGFSIAIQNLEGIVPFDMRTRRIEISDARGVWLTIDNAHLAIAAGGLLRGRVHIADLAARQIEIARAP